MLGPAAIFWGKEGQKFPCMLDITLIFVMSCPQWNFKMMKIPFVMKMLFCWQL